jgi:hypothetical protein
LLFLLLLLAPPLQIFKKHHETYRFFEDQVGLFVSENWERWNHERPKFFTKKFVKGIPLSVLNEEIKEELLAADEHENERVTESAREGERDELDGSTHAS